MEDPEEAHAMALASKIHRDEEARFRGMARGYRDSIPVEPSAEVVAQESPIAAEDRAEEAAHKEGSAQRAEKFADEDAKKADRMEKWAQALHRHPELADEEFYDETVSAAYLAAIEASGAEYGRNAAKLDRAAEEVETNPLDFNQMYRIMLDLSHEVGDDRVDSYKTELNRLRADNATTVGQLKSLFANTMREAAAEHKKLADDAQTFLDRFK